MAMKARTIALGLALFTTPLLANMNPTPQAMLVVVSILPSMAILTAIGGGYALMRRLNRKRRIVAKTVGIVVALLFAGVSEGFTFIIVLGFAFSAIVRAVHLIQWGTLARGADPEGPFAGVKPARMVTAGVLILLILLVFVSMTAAFTGAWDLSGYRYSAMRKYVTYRLALRTPPSPERSKLETEAARNFRYFTDTMEGLNGRGKYRIEEHGTHFVIYLPPNVRKFPSWPYDRLFSARSYRADDTGAIRMLYVHSYQWCSADAPVVDRVGSSDVKALLEGKTTDLDLDSAPRDVPRAMTSR